MENATINPAEYTIDKIRGIKLRPITKDTYWLTFPELVEYTHLGVKALQGFMYDGSLPYYRPRKNCLFKKKEVDAFIEKSHIVIHHINAK